MPAIPSISPKSAGSSSNFPDLSDVPPFQQFPGYLLTPTSSLLLRVDLLPGVSSPKGHLYSLSAPETEALNKYIQSSLANGLIGPSSSLTGAGFFFVEKKDKSPRPCIDYRSLNDVTVKNR